MAKKLVHKYSFTPSTNTIVLDGMHNLNRFLLISNVTTNETMFTFNDNVNGMASHAIDRTTETTTVVLDYDCSAMLSTHTLQVFVEDDQTTFRPEEAFVDPVHKFRVSNPENLIDTDFEYGVQSSKWETLELSNNVPSFYGKNSDYSLLGINIVRATAGSDIIRVTVTDPHRISKGTPIDVQGLTALTGEGKYLVSDIEDDFTFTYKARGVQQEDANLKTPYTTIVPGTFYTGADINYDPTGIQTDAATKSTITVTTPTPHGFKTGSKFYFLNTVSPKTIIINEPGTNTADDGLPVIDVTDTETATITPDLTQTDTKAVRGAYELRFDASAVNTSNSTFTWNSHGLRENDCLVYVKPAGVDSRITPLTSLEIYYVTNPTTNTFQLKENYNSAPLTITDAGTYNYGKAVFMLAYEIQRFQSQSQNTYYYTFGHVYGNASNYSGWDLATGTGLGKMQTAPDYMMNWHRAKASGSTGFRNFPYYFLANYGVWYGTTYSGNHTSDNHTTYPSSFNFVEDFTRWSSYPPFNSPANSNYISYNSSFLNWSSLRATSSYSGYTWNFGRGDFFIVPMNENPEADSFYAENHGLTDGQSITFNTSGQPVYYYTHGQNNFTTNYTPNSLSSGTYLVEVVDDDRFRLKSGTTTIRISAASGSYQFTGIRQRPTRNSFYVENHGFAENNLVTAGTEFGGLLPATNNGPIIYESSRTNLEAFYGACNQGLQAFINNMSAQADLTMDGPSNYQPFLYGSGSSTNTTMAGGFTLYFQGYDNTWSSWGISGGTWNTGAYDTGEVEDTAIGYPVAGQGHSIIMTPYIKDSVIPYWSAAYKMPLNRYGYGYLQMSHSITNGYNIDVQNTNQTNPTPWTTVGVNGVAGGTTTDWRFARLAQYTNAGPTRDCIVQVTYSIKKDNWDPYNFYSLSYNRDNSPSYAYFTSANYNHVSFSAIFRVPGSITMDATFFDNLDAYIMDTLVDGYKYPALSNGVDYKVSVVDDNRFRLKSLANIEVNLTDTGIAGPAGDTSYQISNDSVNYFVIDGINNPTLYLKRGYTYTFSISAAGHPFWIQSVEGAYSLGDLLGTEDGITNNGTENGTLIWTVPANFATGTYYYVCQNHQAMAGTIIVDDTPAQLTFLDISNQIGVLDGVYTATAVPDANSIEFALNFNAGKKSLSVIQGVQTDNDLIYIANGHRLADGTAVKYNANNNAVWTNFVEGQTYYVTVVDDDYLQISDSLDNYRDQIYMELDWTAIPSSTHILESTTVNGLVPIEPVISVETGSKIVDGGADSIFLTYYKAGDDIIIKDPSTTPGTLKTFTISSVVDDSLINLVDPVTFTSSNAVHLVPTKLYTRPDGATTHRPFDGGVEIIAGSAPGSQIVRQTRKYFRYQSGKGIQISLAINFNPPNLVQSIQAITDTKCERDVGYIVDGARLDMALGTTYWAYFNGIAETNSLYLNETVNQRLTKAKNDILALPQVDDSSTAETRINSYFTEVLDIIDNGRLAANAPVFGVPTNVTSGRQAAHNKLLANLEFLEAEVNAFVAENYPNADHDVEKCTRDIKYAVYSLAHDILYGGNAATWNNGRFFAYFDNDPDTSGIYASHKQQTIDAYNHFKSLMSDIVTGTTITPTSGNTETQDTTGTNATATEATTLEGLVDIITDVIEFGTGASGLGQYSKTEPSITWASSELQDAAADIVANKATIQISYATRIVTKYPHTLKGGQRIIVTDCDYPEYNGTFTVTTIIDEFTYLYSLPDTPSVFSPSGIIQYRPEGWTNSAVRCGMYDFQNGFFYEYDGQNIYAVRRNSTTQLSGTCRATYNSNEVIGSNTSFNGQLTPGDLIVLRGQTYKVTSINSNTNLTIQPKYRGTSTAGIILTKTIDLKVPQSEWNIDKCDGNGPSNFLLDTTKIQMAYMDYSWYGAGKIRFGFKDTYGHVHYAHEMTHNNRITEAYMRSGNLPARYEIENFEEPTYQPKLFHWGTSVIMDGTFDDDKAYLFTAASNTLSFTNGQSLTATTNGQSRLIGFYNQATRTREWYVELFFPTNDSTKFSIGKELYTATGTLNGETVSSTYFSGSSVIVRIFIASQWNTPSIYPIVPSGQVVNIGSPATGSDDTSLLADIPLISIRLAPSVDNGITGFIGDRDIINRMQLQLKSIGLVLTHDCEVKLILNGSLSNVDYEKVQQPSLSNLVHHNKGDSVTGGTPIFSFRAAGGTVSGTTRLSNATDFDLTDITDLGNSILGGDGVFPNGPDVLTITVRVLDTSDITSGSPFECGARVTWSESQA
jgi:hypothetical protein